MALRNQIDQLGEIEIHRRFSACKPKGLELASPTVYPREIVGRGWNDGRFSYGTGKPMAVRATKIASVRQMKGYIAKRFTRYHT